MDLFFFSVLRLINAFYSSLLHAAKDLTKYQKPAIMIMRYFNNRNHGKHYHYDIVNYTLLLVEF